MGTSFLKIFKKILAGSQFLREPAYLLPDSVLSCSTNICQKSLLPKYTKKLVYFFVPISRPHKINTLDWFFDKSNSWPV